MTTRKRALTAQIKPATRNAIMDQLAVAADEIERLRGLYRATCDAYFALNERRWWHRLLWWRA